MTDAQPASDPFDGGVLLAWRASLTPAQAALLRQGFTPRSMDHKWAVRYVAPYLYCERSWTGQPVYRLRLEETPQGVEIAEALWARALTNRPGADPVAEARSLAYLVQSLLQAGPARR